MSYNHPILLDIVSCKDYNPYYQGGNISTKELPMQYEIRITQEYYDGPRRGRTQLFFHVYLDGQLVREGFTTRRAAEAHVRKLERLALKEVA